MRKAVEPVDDKTVLLSVHDISPVYEDDVVETYDLLTDMGISSLALLITPFYGMKRSNSFSRGSPFTEFLLSLDLELSLHGYSHFTKSGAMNEFSSLSSERTLSRLKDGVTLFQQGFGQKPIGFVPPLWTSPARIVKATREAKLAYCVEGNNIYRLSDSATFSTAERVISQGQRSINFESAIFEIELGGSLQIGIHPTDYKTNTLFELLSDLLDRQEYRFIGYRDFLHENRK